jgi:LysM repeat protein
VSTTHIHRRPRKIRRTGRHTTPSQVEKVAEKAGKAAPAVAIAGVLVAGPAANAATATHAKATTTAVQVHKASSTPAKSAKAHKTAKKVTHVAASRSYVVQEGDTLASIAQRFYGNFNDWTWIYDANKSVVSNPNSIFPGERLQIPSSGSSSSSASTAASTASKDAPRGKHAKPAAATLTSAAVPSGTLSCSGLEQLWEDAGGSSGEAFMAAEIAMAESGGQQYALSPTDDRGYWQINASWGSLSTYDALGNAKAAVYISADGTNWSPWTTYTSGAYYGRC